MDCKRRHPLRWSLIAAALTVIGSSCHELPKQPGRGVVVLQEGRLAELNPADVAVAPIEVVAGVKAPLDRLRVAIAEGLPARQYTPLSLDFIDSRVVEATYSYGAGGEEAVCQVTVYAWDERYWDTGNSIEVDIELSLIDPSAPDGPTLWTGRLTRRIDVTEYQNTEIEAKLYEVAIEQVAHELLSALPSRGTSAVRG